MTDLLTRPDRSTDAPPRGRGRRLPLVAVVSASWAAGLGLAVVVLVVLLAWATDAASTAGSSAALHVAGQAWLLAHDVPIDVPGGRLGLVPLGLAALPVGLLWRAGRAVARANGAEDLAAAGRLTGLLATTYGGIAAVVAGFAETPAARVAPLRAFAGAATLAAVVAGTAVLRERRLGEGVLRRLPASSPALLAAATTGLLVLGATGALLVGTSLGWHAGRYDSLSRAVGPGLSGGAGMLVVALTLAPNAVVWGAAFAVGPGFAMGTGTSVTPFGVSLHAAPALPLLAALPAAGSSPGAGLVALLGPLVAGGAIAAVVVRRRPALPGVRAAACAAAGALLAALGLGVAAWLAGGAVGPGRLGVTGPSPWAVTLAAAGELAPVAAAAAWWWTRRSGRARVSG